MFGYNYWTHPIWFGYFFCCYWIMLADGVEKKSQMESKVLVDHFRIGRCFRNWNCYWNAPREHMSLNIAGIILFIVALALKKN